MNRTLILFTILAATSLGACQKRAGVSDDATSRGRYAGAGVYSAGTMWQRLVRAEQPKEADAARLKDDEQVIIVVDTQTGELRQCGNLTGYCISMNPWTAPVGPGQKAPVPVSPHALGLDIQIAPAETPTAEPATPQPSAPAP